MTDKAAQAQQRRALVLEGPIPRALLTLAVPIILANLLQTAYQLTDAFWVGRLGASAVAAISVSFPVTFLVIALGSGLAMAGATMSAQYMGAGRQDMVLPGDERGGGAGVDRVVRARDLEAKPHHRGRQGGGAGDAGGDAGGRGALAVQ